MTATVEVITFPDAVEHALTYLRGSLTTAGDTATVDNRVPNPRPVRLVKVNRTGGYRLDLVRERVNLTVECWAPRSEQAHDLAQLCRGLLWVMPDRYTGCTTYLPPDPEVGGIVELPDPDTESPRFTFTLQLDFRGAAL